jgi:hypothetical protein
MDYSTKNSKIRIPQLKKVNDQVRDPKAGFCEQVNYPSSSIQRGKVIPCKSSCCSPKKFLFQEILFRLSILHY